RALWHCACPDLKRETGYFFPRSIRLGSPLKFKEVITRVDLGQPNDFPERSHPLHLAQVDLGVLFEEGFPLRTNQREPPVADLWRFRIFSSPQSHHVEKTRK